MRVSFRKAHKSMHLVFLAVTAVAATAQWIPPDTPAFHRSVPSAPLPKLLAAADRQGVYFTRPYQTAAYAMADQVPELLYQMPCYCRCDLAMRHKSLHSCFEGTHAAVCATCLSEAAYVYNESHAGKTAAAIRSGIVRGDWQQIDLEAIHIE